MRRQHEQGAHGRAKMIDGARAGGSSDDVKRAVKRGILLNEYLLRRAWGVLFIVLALSMFISDFGVAVLGVEKSFGLPGLMATTMTESGCGLIVILWTFRRVRYAAEITHPEDVPAWSRILGYRFLVPLWIVTNAVAFSTIVLASGRLPLVFFLIRIGLAAFMYYALGLSFSKKIPGEAVIAVGSLALSSLASLALLSVVASTWPYALLGLATVAAWVSSGVYARTRPVPEFEEELNGLE